MKALRICLITLCIAALVAVSGQRPLSQSIETGFGVAVQPTSIVTNPVSSPIAVASSSDSLFPHRTGAQDPRTKCFTYEAAVTPPPQQIGGDPADGRLMLELDSYIVRLVPIHAAVVQNPTQPPSDRSGHLDDGHDFCPATVIESLPYSDTGTLADKQSDFIPICMDGNEYPDVIYSYTATRSGLHGAELSGDIYSGSISIRGGGECPGTTELACDDSYGSPRRVTYNFVVGSTYYFVVDGTLSEGNNYTFRLIAASDCAPDFDLAAPGSVSGNTCFAYDNCPAVAGEDQLVRVSIPHDGRWQFDLCDGEAWDARLVLSQDCCSGNVIAQSTYGCDWDNETWISRPRISPRTLTAGIYYIHVEGYFDGACGPYTLTVIELPPCTTRPPNDDCVNAGPPATLPTIFEGDNTCATRDCSLLTQGQGETWHAFMLDTPSDVIIDDCGSPNRNYSMYRILTTGCPCQSLIQYSEVAYGYCDGDYSTFISFRNLAAGTYYYPVLRDSASGTEGPYAINVRIIPSCRLEPDPADVIECLDSPDLSEIGQDCDAGCSVNNGTQQPITVGQSVFGRSFTYNDSYGHVRSDVDWFTFTLEDTSSLSVTVTAEFPIQVALYDGECRAWALYTSSEMYVACSTFTLTSTCLQPHFYSLSISPGRMLAPSDTAHYRFTVTSAACEWPIALEQESEDIPEAEPVCTDGQQDVYNAGCSGSPELFEEISCGQTIFGSSGIYHIGSSLYRDMDWYQFTVTEPSRISLSVVAEFDPYLIIAPYCPGCDGGLVEVSGVAGDTVSGRTYCVESGLYYAAAFPVDWRYMPCGSHYRMWVDCAPCAPCPDLQQPQDIVETEPPCTTWVNYDDHYNGGCNSSPPVFGPPIQCGQSVWGKTGTWWSGYRRDTDWLPISLPEGGVIPRLCVVAQFDVMTAIIGPDRNNGCDSVQVYSEIGLGEPCDTVCVSSSAPMEAGDYWLYIAPSGYSGIICGQQYRAWIQCDPCMPDTVTDMTIRRIGDDIVLRWSHNPAFAGTYTVFHTTVYESNQEVYWEPLIAGLASTAVGQRVIYTHVGAATATDRQYYMVVGMCP